MTRPCEWQWDRAAIAWQGPELGVFGATTPRARQSSPDPRNRRQNNGLSHCHCRPQCHPHWYRDSCCAEIRAPHLGLIRDDCHDCPDPGLRVGLVASRPGSGAPVVPSGKIPAAPLPGCAKPWARPAFDRRPLSKSPKAATAWLVVHRSTRVQKKPTNVSDARANRSWSGPASTHVGDCRPIRAFTTAVCRSCRRHCRVTRIVVLCPSASVGTKDENVAVAAATSTAEGGFFSLGRCRRRERRLAATVMLGRAVVVVISKGLSGCVVVVVVVVVVAKRRQETRGRGGVNQ